jgi:hypothetical protein
MSIGIRSGTLPGDSTEPRPILLLARNRRKRRIQRSKGAPFVLQFCPRQMAPPGGPAPSLHTEGFSPTPLTKERRLGDRGAGASPARQAARLPDKETLSWRDTLGRVPNSLEEVRVARRSLGHDGACPSSVPGGHAANQETLDTSFAGWK